MADASDTNEEKTGGEEVQSSSKRSSGSSLGTLAVLGVVALVIGLGAGYFVGTSMHSSSPAATTTASPDYVYLSINGGCAWCSAPFNASDMYSPANFSVPSHTLIILTITNYDNGQNPMTGSQNQVTGVVGNVEYQNATPPSNWGTQASSVGAGDLSHTFTVKASSSFSGFSVPIPASEGPQGSSVTVKLYLNETGTFSWMCLTPCDSWSMGSAGYMAGTINVV